MKKGWILHFTMPTDKTCVQEAFTCAWGCTFESGDYVVSNTYYQKWGRGENNCV